MRFKTVGKTKDEYIHELEHEVLELKEQVASWRVAALIASGQGDKVSDEDLRRLLS